MRRWVVRGLFVAALAALPVQTLVRHGGTEPYPGVYQPSFGGEVPQGSDYRTYEPVVMVRERDGATRTVDYRDVLPHTAVLPLPVFKSAFADDRRAGDPRTGQWLRERLLALSPGSDPQEVTVTWAYVERRIGSTVPGATDVDKVETIDVAGR